MTSRACRMIPLAVILNPVEQHRVCVSLYLKCRPGNGLAARVQSHLLDGRLRHHLVAAMMGGKGLILLLLLMLHAGCVVVLVAKAGQLDLLVRHLLLVVAVGMIIMGVA